MFKESFQPKDVVYREWACLACMTSWVLGSTPQSKQVNNGSRIVPAERGWKMALLVLETVSVVS